MTRCHNVRAAAGIVGMVAALVAPWVLPDVPPAVFAVVLAVGLGLLLALWWVAMTEAQPARQPTGSASTPAVPCCCLPTDDGRSVVDRDCPVHSPNRHIGADR